MPLTSAQDRAIELMLEQMDRFQGLRENRPGVSAYPLVKEFYETSRGANFEMMILNKIGLLLAPESKEDLNLEIMIRVKDSG